MEETKREKTISENYDDWVKCFRDKKFPKGKEFTYEEWRRFWDFWYLEYQELPLKVAFQIYEIKKQEIVR